MCDTPHCHETKEPLIIAKCPKCDIEIDCKTFIDNKNPLQKIRCECGADVVPDLYIDGELAKQCKNTECGEIKPITEFPKHPNGRHGCRNECNLCWNNKLRPKKRQKKYQTEFEHPEKMFKECKGPCGEVKDFNQFHKNAGRKDGRDNICKGCTNKPEEPDYYIDGKLAKKCRGECGEIKLLEEFYDEKRGKYGKKGDCKKCFNKQRKAYRQSPEGKAKTKAYRKEYNNRPEVKERNKEYGQQPEVKERNNEYNNRPEVKERRRQRDEENRRKGSGRFENLNLPELNWNKGNELCPWMQGGVPFDIDIAEQNNKTHMLFVLVARDGKGIIPDNSLYAGITNLITNEWISYTGHSWHADFKKYLKKHKHLLERHVIEVAETVTDIGDLEIDLLAHDDGTGIPRWKPERTDWINLHPGGQVSAEIFNPEITEEIIKRFGDKINKHGTQTEYVDTPCWEWTAAKTSSGYGMFSIKGKNIKAHRLSKMIYNNHKFQKGEQANHKCHNPACVNPKHIYIGTAAENSRDMHEAGRNPNLKNENNSNTKLSWKEVNKIRKMYATGNYTQAEIAKKFKISKIYAHQIIKNKVRKE